MPGGISPCDKGAIGLLLVIARTVLILNTDTGEYGAQVVALATVDQLLTKG